MFHCPAAHVETVCRKDAEDSNALMQNNSWSCLEGSGFWAAPVCATRLWVSVGNIELLDLYGLIPDVLPILFTGFSSSEMPLLFPERMKS